MSDDDDIETQLDEADDEDFAEPDLAEPDLGEDLDEEDLADGLEDLDGDEFVGEIDALGTDEDQDVVDIDPAAERPRARTGDEKEDEDDEEVDPDDVEADLDTILKDRLEAYDEDAEDDEEEEVQAAPTEEGDLPSKREGEFPCPSCFLLVNVKQIARSGSCPHCGDPIQIPSSMV